MHRGDPIALLLVLAAVLAAGPALAQQEKCSIPGERIHWAADYCMAKLETDDEIAAGECINGEMDKRFASACAAKRRYKKALCELSIERNVRKGSVARCVADPKFFGTTVERGGVGG